MQNDNEICKTLDWLLKQEHWKIKFLFDVCPLIKLMPNEIKREFQIKDVSEKYRVPVYVIKTIMKYKDERTKPGGDSEQIL